MADDKHKGQSPGMPPKPAAPLPSQPPKSPPEPVRSPPQARPNGPAPPMPQPAIPRQQPVPGGMNQQPGVPMGPGNMPNVRPNNPQPPMGSAAAMKGSMAGSGPVPNVRGPPQAANAAPAAPVRANGPAAPGGQGYPSGGAPATAEQPDDASIKKLRNAFSSFFE